MRDVLTLLAGLLIVALAALLAVPPFLDWPAHRSRVDRALTRAIGEPVRTEGPLAVRLLPTPRLRAGRVLIGSGLPGSASLDATSVRAEIALTPLLSGEVRLRQARVARAEIKLPSGPDGGWRIPARLASGENLRRPWAVEGLSVGQLLVTTVDPGTGRTDQALAEGLRVQAGSPAGPWRVEGVSGSVPFEIALGEMDQNLSAQLKAGAGGGTRPRLDIDGRIELVRGAGDTLQPRFAGTGRLGAAPAAKGETRIPAQAQATLAASGRAVALTKVSIEIGDAAPLRLTGEGSVRLDAPRLTLSLNGRRFDLAGFWAANGAALGREWRAPAGLPIELSVGLGSLAVGADEDLSNVDLRLLADGDRLEIGELTASGPGGSGLKASGALGLGGPDVSGRPSGSGRVEVTARDSERFGRFLASTGLVATTAVLDGRPLEAAADVTVAAPVISLRNLRVALGDARVTGALRRTEAEAGARARIDAQLAVENVDLATLPDGGPLFAAARGTDLGLTFDARGVAYGEARGGRIAGRFSTDGPAILVERLEVRDLAGAEATLSGRIGPDGAGRIEGRLRAARAAPLVDLFGRAWIGGLVRVVPDAVRDGPVDLTVAAERVPGGAGAAPALRTTVEGRIAGGPFTATTTGAGGVVAGLTATASTDNDATWLGAGPAGVAGSPERPRRRATLSLSATRTGAGRLAFDGRGNIAGVQVVTARPVEFGGDDDALERGEIELTAGDAAGLLTLAGFPAVPTGPLSLKATVSRDDALRVALTGRAAGEDVSAELARSPTGDIAGTASLSRLSLPWLASVLALNTGPGGAVAGSAWSSVRFARREPTALGLAIRIKAAALELRAGLVGQDATLLLSTSPDGFRIGELDAALGGGRLRGAVGVGRQGGLASLIGEGSVDGVALAPFVGTPFGPGRVSASLRFGGSGESLAGLVANLGGAGEATFTGLAVAAADPGAVGRVAGRVLRSDDPLASARWQPLLADELGRGSLGADRMAASASMVGGTMRLAPLRAETAAGSWQGSAAIDLRTLVLDARGTLQSGLAPNGWTGPPPAVTLGWSGPLARPVRTVDPGPLVNGLAAVVLARELDRIENFEIDSAEQQRRNARTEMDRQRRLAAEEAARQARLRAEAEERARVEAERLRREAEERARQAEQRQREAERRRQESERRGAEPAPDRPSPPLDIRPPVQAAPGQP